MNCFKVRYFLLMAAMVLVFGGPVQADLFVTIGDSITQGWPYVLDNGDGRQVGGYQPDLEDLLNQDGSGHVVLNYGVAGEITEEGLDRIADILQANNPDYVLILEGINDSYNSVAASTTISNLSLMIDECRIEGAVPIIATLSPVTDPGYYDPDGISSTYNPAIIDLADEKGVKVCDLYSALEPNWDSLNFDGLHPNEDGYAVMAEAWYETFLSDEPSPPKPSVTTDSASAVEEFSAMLNGEVNPNGYDTSYYFEYGTSTSYDNNTETFSLDSGYSNVSVSNSVEDLSGGITYYFRIVAENENGISYGDAISFTTNDTTRPNVETLPATDGGEDYATLNGTVQPNGYTTQYYFEYGLTTDFGNQSDTAELADENTEETVSWVAEGLQSESVYYFRIVAVSSAGTSYGETESFETVANEDSGSGCFIGTLFTH